MSLAWRLARRDLRAAGRGLWLLALCLFLGTAALAGIGSLSASIEAALTAESRAMLGGDLELRVSQRRATVEEGAAFAARGRVSESIGLRAMLGRPGGDSVLASLRAVDGGWPLVGEARFAGRRPGPDEVAVAPALADRLGLRLGDTVALGAARLRLVGLILDAPDRLGEFAGFGLPAMIDLRTLDRTALIQPGSLYESRYRLLLPPGADAAAIGKALVARAPSGGWTARTPADAAATLRRTIAELGQFLLLIGLAALAIGGVGVGSGVSAYLAEKTRMVAMLKVLGARASTIAQLFLIELGLVALGGIGAGLAAGAALPLLVARLAGAALPIAPRLGLYPAPLAVAAGLSLLAALLFALPALARARAVPAAALLRDQLAPARRPGLRLALAMAATLIAILALAVASASDRVLAAEFLGATAALLLLLWLLGLGLRTLLRRLPRARHPLVRLALTNLHRPGAQTDRLVVALGLGYALFVALAGIDTSLSAELAGVAPARAPRFFAIDLQPEDRGTFLRAVRGVAPGARIEAVPSLRGAIVALNGRRVAAMRTLPEGAWILRGDRTLTWSATVPPRNRVVAGQWWPAGYRGPPLVSMEDKAARLLGLKVGDTLTVAVLGVEVPARIAALRAIDWSGMGLNFALVFSPGYIEEAPHALLASVYAPADRDGAIGRAVARVLPSVTLVRTGDILGTIGDLTRRMALAVRLAAAVTVAAGLAVLTGAIAASARARRRDAVVLKLLGGRVRQVLAVQALEYGLLALLLAAVALAVGLGAGWLVVTRVLAIGWAPDALVIARTLAAAMLVTLGVGVLGTWPVLRARAAEGLRSG
ncbi:ABC transporter permease [Sphingomonas morindae]|uniref:ABC transporter permease n=1 Tax=Sphingomonas morindae TaxID=1541170 RepID=A0ABY4X595_9SPHN|nr:FtsX-like permease family protein [Sphingomonas morindae]USI72063.1 ABC transporter permease [Sphingomonas morindae]